MKIIHIEHGLVCKAVVSECVRVFLGEAQNAVEVVGRNAALFAGNNKSAVGNHSEMPVHYVLHLENKLLEKSCVHFVPPLKSKYIAILFLRFFKAILTKNVKIYYFIMSII